MDILTKVKKLKGLLKKKTNSKVGLTTSDPLKLGIVPDNKEKYHLLYHQSFDEFCMPILSKITPQINFNLPNVETVIKHCVLTEQQFKQLFTLFKGPIKNKTCLVYAWLGVENETRKGPFKSFATFERAEKQMVAGGVLSDLASGKMGVRAPSQQQPLRVSLVSGDTSEYFRLFVPAKYAEFCKPYLINAGVKISSPNSDKGTWNVANELSRETAENVLLALKPLTQERTCVIMDNDLE